MWMVFLSTGMVTQQWSSVILTGVELEMHVTGPRSRKEQEREFMVIP